MNPCTRADIHNIIRGTHGILVMFHHNQRIAQVPHFLHRANELVIVPLMQADGGFVQHIHDPCQPGTDLCGQTDPLCFSA